MKAVLGSCLLLSLVPAVASAEEAASTPVIAPTSASASAEAPSAPAETPATASASAGAPSAPAETAETTSPDNWALGFGLHYTRPDSSRDTKKRATGWQLHGTYLLGHRFWLEGQYTDTTIETGPGRGTDFYRRALNADLQYLLGNRYSLTPFLVAGVGAVHNDVIPDRLDHTGFTGNLGVGLLVPVYHVPGLSFRADVRAIYDRFEGSTVDYRAAAGLEIRPGEFFRPKEIVTIKEVPVPVEKVVVQEKLVYPPDSDHDGVPDDRDLCPNTLEGATVDSHGCVVTPQTFRIQDVAFAFDSAELTLNGRRLLDNAVEFLKSQMDLKVEIAGHTDNVGTAKYNLKLSQRRAESARAYLMSKGIDPARLTAKGYGLTEPVATNETDAGREINRRVELRVTPTAPPAKTADPA